MDDNDPSRDDRTLVVFFSMPHSGVGLAANLFHRFDMALGLRERTGLSESNKRDRDASPTVEELHRSVQLQCGGSVDEALSSPEALERFLQTYPLSDSITFSADLLDQAKILVRQWTDVSPVAGLIDPQTVLLWPFWRQVFDSMPGLRVVPVFLIRSPHEIAMSMFMHGNGDCSYERSLDIAGAYLQCMEKAVAAWGGVENASLVRFGSPQFAEDIRRAVERSGLAWSDAIYREAFDASCIAQKPATVNHRAQELFERLGGRCDCEQPDQIQRDAALREAELCRRTEQLAEELARNDGKRKRLAKTLQRRSRDILHLRRKAEHLGQELQMIERSRLWKMRDQLVSAMRFLPGMRGRYRKLASRLDAAPNADSRAAVPDRVPQEYTRRHAAHQMPKVSVIIVNYNGLEHLPGCLKSLFNTDYPNFDVTLVDNGSHDASVDWVLDHYPEVNILCSPENCGFGKANHLGISQTDGPIVVLLNNDTIVHRDWLWPLVEPLMDNERVAATSSKLRFMEQPRVLNGVGGSMNLIGLAFDLGIHEVDAGQWDEPREVLFPCGAACAIRRSVFDAVGGFDDSFFMYHEDVDLGWRIRMRGYSIRTAPQSVVYHRFGGTSKKSSSFFREQLGLRHDLRSLIKNYELRTLCRVLPLFFVFLAKAIVATRSFRHLRCISWNLVHLRDTLQQRRAIQRQRTVSDRELAPLIYPRQGVPFRELDYAPIHREDFLRSGSRKSWIGLADKRCSHLGFGWHGVEIDPFRPNISFRWAQREAVAYLWNRTGRGTLELHVLASTASRWDLRQCSVHINGTLVKHFSVRGTHWKIIRIPYDGEPGPLEITIHTKNTWHQHQITDQEDHRELGLGVRQIQFLPHVDCRQKWAGISVIIPTHNRCDKLQKVLQALEGQTLPKNQFEVIVIDDGSTDATARVVAEHQKNSQLRLSYAYQKNQLQGAARNHGLKLAREELILFIGDDIIPTQDFLVQHLDFHRHHNPAGDAAVVGRIDWPTELRPTPFMRFINDCGPQFGFAMMNHVGPWQFDCFYTSNISMPRRMLDSLEYVFDEDFKQYGWEDAELGHRLECRGMRLLHNPNALAHHDHPTTVTAFCRRQRNVGKCSRLFLEKHPQLEALLGSGEKMRPRARLRSCWIALAWAVDIWDRTLRKPLPPRCYVALLNSFYAQGVIEGQVEPCRQPIVSTSCSQPTTEHHSSSGKSSPSSNKCKQGAGC